MPRPAIYDAVVLRLKRILLALTAALGFLVYVWVAAVRAAPGVRRRKAAARAARRRQTPHV